MKRLFLTLGFIGLTTVALADVPVVDYSPDGDQAAVQSAENSANDATAAAETPAPVAPAPKPNLSMDQRVTKLEGQMDNLNHQNLSGKVDDLQQRMQTISGKLEEQEHQIEQLSNQSKSFYQDLNQRLDKGKPVGDKAVPSVANTTTAVKTVTPAVATKKTQADSDVASLQEQQLYQTAIDLLPDKKYDESAQKLHTYVTKYPKGAYVSNAHYWLGEIAFLQKKYDQAEKEFQVVVTKYPTSKKVADALLKVALVHEAQGKHEQARNELKQVTQKYPNTTAAQLAKQQLETN